MTADLRALLQEARVTMLKLIGEPDGSYFDVRGLCEEIYVALSEPAPVPVAEVDTDNYTIEWLCDEKDIPGIGTKLYLAPPPAGEDAEVTQLKQNLAGWLEANGPGGWIDEQRQALAQTEDRLALMISISATDAWLAESEARVRELERDYGLLRELASDFEKERDALLLRVRELESTK
jgi:hypothetical protein